MKELNLLLITDIHFIYEANALCNIPKRKTALGKELVQRIGRWITTQQVDGIVLLGDLVDQGNATGSEKDINILKDVIETWNIPIIVVPGNHDDNPQKMLDIFEDCEGIHELNGYQLITFVDEYTDEKAFRDFNKMENILSKADNQKPIIVFQHNPVIPYIDSSYPYNIMDYNKIAKAYTDNKVILSVSGHAHWGIPLTYHDNVGYLTCPALCEEPYQFCMLTINQSEINVTQHQLKIPENLFLSDYHVHSHFAYCGHDEMIPEKIVERATDIGLKNMAFTEHAGQLYVSDEIYWKGIFINKPHLIQENINTDYDRMLKYREAIKKLRNNNVKLGLEIEVDCNGDITLLERDKHDWDIIVGAVHFLPEKFDNNIINGFMWCNEQLLSHKINVLAHPFRYFKRKKMPTPIHLYRPLAKLLSSHNTAVELNFHINKPDPEFFNICLEEGVKISFGSDAHEMNEVGCFQRHLDFMELICGNGAIQDHIYNVNSHIKIVQKDFRNVKFSN